MITDEKPGKKAMLFGGTDGHGITMTAISYRNLIKEGYEIDPDLNKICKFVKGLPRSKREVSKEDIERKCPEGCGTGSPEFFWGHTFLQEEFDDPDLALIVVVDIPLPLQVNLNYSAADEAIKKIKDLCAKKIRVVLVDHHKRAITHYGKAIDAGAELLFSIGSEQYCHYGLPDEYSFFWGSRGAICDRDSSQLPLEKDEFCPFSVKEHDADWLDIEKKNLQALLKKILEDDRFIPGVSEPQMDIDYCVQGSVAAVKRLNPDNDEKTMGGFKQLDYLCSRTKSAYGVGINDKGTTIHVINYWKINSLPVALLLSQYRDESFGHDTGVVIAFNERDPENITKKFEEIIDRLNSQKIIRSDTGNSEADAIGYISHVFHDVPIATHLTKHGWNHVETVLANARLLGYLSNLNDKDQAILNWSALFHDLGNAAMSYKDKYNLKVTDHQEARDKHEEYTVQILHGMQEEGMFSGVIPGKDLEEITDLCLRHRKKRELPENQRLMKLCVLLRIADALDKTKSRARENDAGDLYSKVRKKLLCDENIVSIMHWEGQRAIESIRLNITKSRIVFEFFVSDKEKAQFIICDFKEELAPLQNRSVEGIPTLEVKVFPVPLLS
jgi:hypothetical protein